MSISFDLMQEADIPSVREIVEGFMVFNPEQIKAYLSEKQNTAHIAKLDGTTIGLIYGYSLTRLDGKEPQFFIYSVDIHPAYQDRGYGSRFVQYVVDWARDNGFSESFVPTDRDNPRACRVYEKAGMARHAEDISRVYEIYY